MAIFGFVNRKLQTANGELRQTNDSACELTLVGFHHAFCRNSQQKNSSPNPILHEFIGTYIAMHQSYLLRSVS